MIAGGKVANTYKKIPIKDVIDAHPEKELVQRILLGTRPIVDLLDAGCYIAGGFGRTLMNGGNVAEYLGLANRESYDSCRPGDIDIFFSDASRAEEYRQIFGSESRSLGKNALEKTLNGYTRLQLVDGPDLISSLEEQMDRFDFTNACVAITREHVIVHERFEQIERDKLLDVKSCHSPFLGSRIMKYFKYRGMQAVTPSSEALITEWIIRALSLNFDIVSQTKIMPGSIDHSIQNILKEKRITRADDLLLVLGRFKTTTTEKYGLVREVDFALENLKERGYEITVPGL
jgi:hypothetical protein